MKRRSFLNSLAMVTGAALTGTRCSRENQSGSDQLPKNTKVSGKGSITVPQREISITDFTDVLVIGGGPSGVAAALAASRAGAKTILIERYNHLGGLWTGGLVLPLLSTHGFSQKNIREKVIFGIGDEINQRLVGMDMSIHEINPVVDPEATKYVLDAMMKEYGVTTYYHSWASNIVSNDDTIQAVILETKSGSVAIKPKVVIDCTGDGDIFHLAGESYDVMQYEIGLVHRLGNIDRIDRTKPGFKEMPIGKPTPIPSVNWVNMSGNGYNDGLDFKKLSELQQQQRIEIWEQVEKIKSVPGYEEVFLLDTAAQHGVRISRFLKGEYRLTLEDSMTYKTFNDVIGVSGAWTNVLYKGKRIQTEKRPLWQIPYRSLVPQKTKNLLVAGRCFSFDQDLFQDTRIIGTCLVTGQGAGVAAALAANSGNSVKEINILKLQKILKEQNVFLG